MALKEIITPDHSPPPSEEMSPLQPQTTGSYFPNFRQSLLGGKTWNRFSSFVTSGAEDWVLNGYPDTEPVNGKEANGHSTSPSWASDDAQHFVDAGPSWRSKQPNFRVMVHSPS